jgi:hypothetical protein
MDTEELNAKLRDAGIPPIAIVSPVDCIPQDVNARYMNQDTMRNLVANIERDGRLESVPLVAPSAVDGKYDIISGHHRIKAAESAGLSRILVMVVEPKSRDELIAKQLSHNAITGEDDEVILQRLYDDISSLEGKYYSGLQDALSSVEFTSLNFRAGSFEEFVVAFLPEQIEDFDAACRAVEETTAKGRSIVRVASVEHWTMFADAIRKVKKTEDVRSSAAALGRLVELAMERLAEIKDNGQSGPKSEAG